MFEERETCFISKHKQGSEEWFNLRKGCITMSTISNCVGRSNFYKSPEIICGFEKTQINENMQRGIRYENILRNYYNQNFNECTELGVGIWKKDIRFRGSLDGEVNDILCVEFKIPKKMYKSLTTHVEELENGFKPPQFYHDHIYDSHYDQMQGNMVIHGKLFCDYVVYGFEDEMLYHEKIELNMKHWDEILYPNAVKYYEKYINPLLLKYNFEILNPFNG